MTGLAPGTEFAGHRIDAVAGRGGMGVVYRATQTALDRVVALKLIVPELADDPELRDRFERESRIAASIDHPNVLPLYYAGEQDGVLYQAMRYVDGTDLRTLVRANGALPPERAVKIVAQIAAALDAAHARGLVHRDVKPANVMLTEGEHAYLGDFGLSRRTASQDASTAGGSVVGTFDYVAPEQIRGERVDARADVYALGGVLFTALTGQVPFPRESDEARLWAHLQAEPPRLSERAPNLPPRLDAVITRALAKRPEDRYPSAGDLARAARAALEGNPISQPERLVAAGEAAPLEGSTVSATIPALPSRRYRAGARRRRLALLIGAMAATAGAAFGVAALLGSGDEGGEALTQGRPTPTPTARDSEGATPTPGMRVTGTVKVGYRPHSVVLAGGYIWVASFNDGVMRMRWPTMSGRQTMRTGRGTGAIATGFGSLWISYGPGRVIERANPRTGQLVVPRLALPHRSRSLAVGAGAVWSAGGVPASIVRVTPDGRRVTGRLPLDAGALAARGRRLWAVGNGSRRLYEIDTRTLSVVRKIPTGARPAGVAVGAGAVWVANTGDDSVMRYDPLTRRKRLINVPDGPSRLVVRGNTLWVTSSESDHLTRIDIRTGRKVELPMTGDPLALAVDPRFAWVTELGRDRVARVAYER
jgi:YVTN family beta-propeller protein